MARFILLKTFNNYIEANIATSMLEEEGINCHLQDENSTVIMTMSSGIRLMVYESQAERAAEIIQRAETEYLKSVPCPICKQNGFTIKYVSESHEDTVRKIPFGKWLVRLSKALTNEGTTLQVKHYVCFNCQKEFDELPT